MSPFEKLNLPARPVLLAPLAGVSDHPFRRICARQGASLTYVEMLSATALLFESPRTYQMMRRHESEEKLGVQVTGKSPDETARAVEILGKLDFETIDLNMGCPVAKVVKAGCGSANIKDPEKVYETVKRAVQATEKPLTVKIRIGWDKSTITALEVADAVEKGGAAWLTVHGRLRSDDYSVPVDLPRIAAIKRRAAIPVFGNGNIFSRRDAEQMLRTTEVDGVMVSRGALGNPWVFREIATGDARVTLDEWLETVKLHLEWQRETYGDAPFAAICMRKHLLWYVKGWPGARRLREQLGQVSALTEAAAIIDAYAESLAIDGVSQRMSVTPDDAGSERFVWDPKFDMDRGLDRGVGDDGMMAIS